MTELIVFQSISIIFLLLLLFLSAHTIKITVNIQDNEFVYIHQFSIIYWLILIGIFIYDSRYYFRGFCILLYIYICSFIN